MSKEHPFLDNVAVIPNRVREDNVKKRFNYNRLSSYSVYRHKNNTSVFMADKSQNGMGQGLDILLSKDNSHKYIHFSTFNDAQHKGKLNITIGSTQNEVEKAQISYPIEGDVSKSREISEVLKKK